jgi:small subunit ribosomal protein S9
MATTTKKKSEAEVKDVKKATPAKTAKTTTKKTTTPDTQISQNITEQKEVLQNSDDTSVKSTKKSQVKNNSKPLYTKARRKTALCVIREVKKGGIVINNKTLKDYFTPAYFADVALQPVKVLKAAGQNFDIAELNIVASVNGGGVKGHAESFSLALAKYISGKSEEFKKTLKQAGLIATDSRVVERKLPGFRKSRKKEQFSKR